MLAVQLPGDNLLGICPLTSIHMAKDLYSNRDHHGSLSVPSVEGDSTPTADNTREATQAMEGHLLPKTWALLMISPTSG